MIKDKPVEELKDKIHKKKEKVSDEKKFESKTYDPFGVTTEPGVPPEVGQVPKDSVMDFTHIAGIGKAKNEEIIKKLEELGVDTTPPGSRAPKITIPSEEIYRIVFNNLLAKKVERKELTMALDDQELKDCGMATDMMLELHGSNWMMHFVEVNFFLTVGGILIPRIIMLIQGLIQGRQGRAAPRDVSDYAPPETPPPEDIVPEATRQTLKDKKKKT